MFPQITFATIPNAFAPPHLGHVYNAMVNRVLWGDCVRTSWGKAGGEKIKANWMICFDKPLAKFKSTYQQLMAWLGFSPDAVIDWSEIDGHTAHSIQAYLVLGMPKVCLSITDELMKLGWYATCNVCRLARSNDKEMRLIIARESMLSDMFRMRVPQSIIHATLLTENGDKINNRNSEPYQIDLGKDDPKQVMGYLVRKVGKIHCDANICFCENKRETIKICANWREEVQEDDVELVPDIMFIR